MVFTYHEVVSGKSSYVYSIDRDLLEHHLRFLSGLPDQSAAHNIPLVSFDDGHASQHRYGLPALESAGVRAVFFVTVGWIGTRKEYMNWTELQELLQHGHDVQCHGWSHKTLTACSPSQLDDELRRSKEVLESKLGRAVDSISIPGGRWNVRTSKACVKAGYSRIYVSDPWLKPTGRNGALHIGRLMVRNAMSVADLQRLAKSEHVPLALVRLPYVAKSLGRKLLGRDVYGYLWRLLGNKRECNEINREYTRS
jgi:peptidoglycan/xylan/chitin deacetylase (PgdA/CDA1 family)